MIDLARPGQRRRLLDACFETSHGISFSIAANGSTALSFSVDECPATTAYRRTLSLMALPFTWNVLRCAWGGGAPNPVLSE